MTNFDSLWVLLTPLYPIFILYFSLLQISEFAKIERNWKLILRFMRVMIIYDTLCGRGTRSSGSLQSVFITDLGLVKILS